MVGYDGWLRGWVREWLQGKVIVAHLRSNADVDTRREEVEEEEEEAEKGNEALFE